MTNFDKQKDYWKPCRPGTILSVTDSKFQRDRRRFLVRSAMGVVVAVTGLISAIFIAAQRNRAGMAKLDNDGESFSGAEQISTDRNMPAKDQGDTIFRIACSDILDNLDQYVVAFKLPTDQRSDDQNELIANFQQHLVVCKFCPSKVEDALRST